MEYWVVSHKHMLPWWSPAGVCVALVCQSLIAWGYWYTNQVLMTAGFWNFIHMWTGGRLYVPGKLFLGLLLFSVMSFQAGTAAFLSRRIVWPLDRSAVRYPGPGRVILHGWVVAVISECWEKAEECTSKSSFTVHREWEGLALESQRTTRSSRQHVNKHTVQKKQHSRALSRRKLWMRHFCKGFVFSAAFKAEKSPLRSIAVTLHMRRLKCREATWFA